MRLKFKQTNVVSQARLVCLALPCSAFLGEDTRLRPDLLGAGHPRGPPAFDHMAWKQKQMWRENWDPVFTLSTDDPPGGFITHGN